MAHSSGAAFSHGEMVLVHAPVFMDMHAFSMFSMLRSVRMNPESSVHLDCHKLTTSVWLRRWMTIAIQSTKVLVLPKMILVIVSAWNLSKNNLWRQIQKKTSVLIWNHGPLLHHLKRISVFLDVCSVEGVKGRDPETPRIQIHVNLYFTDCRAAIRHQYPGFMASLVQIVWETKVYVFERVIAQRNLRISIRMGIRNISLRFLYFPSPSNICHSAKSYTYDAKSTSDSKWKQKPVPFW